MGDAESCSSRAFNSHVIHSIKVEAYNEVFSRLKELNVPEAAVPGFEDELWEHFNRLPNRYSIPLVLFLILSTLLFVFIFIYFVIEKKTRSKQEQFV